VSSEPPIDLADESTFGAEINALLSDAGSWIKEYEKEERRLENDPQGSLAYALRPNRLSEKRQSLIEHVLMPMLDSRSILAWHYTRLLPYEIDGFLLNGIRISNQAHMEDRLQQACSLGHISKDEVVALLSASPLCDAAQAKARSGKFYLVTSRLPASDPGVTLFVSHWGGEVVYFWQENTGLISKIQSLGFPAVVEAVVPITSTRHSYSIAEGMLQSLSAKNKNINAIDIYTKKDLPASAVLRVIREDDPKFFPVSGGQQ
jgi:hypothetical protein